ncbi:unnamed protein product [Rotaria sp. Silwood2]|nr:unnamed protein product [Rotaria sp. Silwood2]CAF3949057.1 unnamed protein product [Rotaria sp. Silwood2]
MLSCIGKRSSSKDRYNQHQIFKNDEGMKKLVSEDEDDHNNKTKKNTKKQSSSTISELVLHFNISPNVNQINQSYSPIDYYPMISNSLLENVNNEKLSTSHESLSDCYLNPSTIIEVRKFFHIS